MRTRARSGRAGSGCRASLERGEKRALRAGEVAELDQVQRQHVEQGEVLRLELEPALRRVCAFPVAVELVERLAAEGPPVRTLERLRPVERVEHAPWLADVRVVAGELEPTWRRRRSRHDSPDDDPEKKPNSEHGGQPGNPERVVRLLVRRRLIPYEPVGVLLQLADCDVGRHAGDGDQNTGTAAGLGVDESDGCDKRRRRSRRRQCASIAPSRAVGQAEPLAVQVPDRAGRERPAEERDVELRAQAPGPLTGRQLALFALRQRRREQVVVALAGARRGVVIRQTRGSMKYGPGIERPGP